jgi:hypothetical protein
MTQHWKSEYTRITDPSDLDGKTVERVSSGTSEALIVFTDSTFVYLVAISYGDDDANIQWDEEISPMEAWQGGLCTEAEFEAAQKARDVAFEAKREAEDRKAYERLKFKFEKGA